jgi:hypothetical protein
MSKLIKERITASRYILWETRPAFLCSNDTVREECGVRCPRCYTDNKQLNHGETLDCNFCNLKITRYGNSLSLEGYKTW